MDLILNNAKKAYMVYQTAVATLLGTAPESIPFDMYALDENAEDFPEPFWKMQQEDVQTLLKSENPQNFIIGVLQNIFSPQGVAYQEFQKVGRQAQYVVIRRVGLVNAKSELVSKPEEAVAICVLTEVITARRSFMGKMYYLQDGQLNIEPLEETTNLEV